MTNLGKQVDEASASRLSRRREFEPTVPRHAAECGTFEVRIQVIFENGPGSRHRLEQCLPESLQ
ncbi:AF-toxin biosynthesis protein 12-1 [Alternaria alternata]|nr:AF-toxin biosynthesis protein 12-1 [Alternaria alternata]